MEQVKIAMANGKKTEMFSLREATLEDARLLFEWRNDPVTRANSINAGFVPWEAHVGWLEKSLCNPNRLLFIGVDGQPVGTSRLDLCESHAEISYTVSPAHRGNGHGYNLVRETLKHSEAPIRATVKPQNQASRRILEKADFKIAGEEDGLMVYVLKS